MGSSAGWRREPPGPGTATLTFMELLPPAPEELRTTAKRTSALLRDARLVQRRLDVLMTTAAASDEHSSNCDKCDTGLRTTAEGGGLRGDPGSCFTATCRVRPGLTVGSTGS